MTIAELKKCTAPLRVDRLAQQEGKVTCSRNEGCGAVKMYVGIRPDGGGSVESQSRQVYQRLSRLLEEQGASRHDVVTEKIFFSDIKTQVEVFRKVREDFYTGVNGAHNGELCHDKNGAQQSAIMLAKTDSIWNDLWVLNKGD